MLTSVAITVEQGETFSRTLRLRNGATPPVLLDIVGWTFKGQIRDLAKPAIITATFTCTPDTINSQVTYALTRTNTLALTPNATYNNRGILLTVLKPAYFFDIFGVKPDGSYVKIRKGPVNVNPSATKT